MVYYSLGAASKACGKSKTTIFKAIKTGKLSYVEKNSREYQIDPAELHRVFPLVTSERNESNKEQRSDNERVTADNSALKAEIAVLRELLESERSHTAYTKEQNQFLQDQLKRTTILLEDMRQKQEPRSKWWKR